mmetsp:Transcript_22902/g.74132  ORF Transcript_22902/g.74132 Transcript_22902/m.74132 type:complete len:209 (+) Transcript_22902:2855-3481(+)
MDTVARVRRVCLGRQERPPPHLPPLEPGQDNRCHLARSAPSRERQQPASPCQRRRPLGLASVGHLRAQPARNSGGGRLLLVDPAGEGLDLSTREEAVAVGVRLAASVCHLGRLGLSHHHCHRVIVPAARHEVRKPAPPARLRVAPRRDEGVPPYCGVDQPRGRRHCSRCSRRPNTDCVAGGGGCLGRGVPRVVDPLDERGEALQLGRR